LNPFFENCIIYPPNPDKLEKWPPRHKDTNAYRLAGINETERRGMERGGDRQANSCADREKEEIDRVGHVYVASLPPLPNVAKIF
jgi:hypothetical protein